MTSRPLYAVLSDRSLLGLIAAILLTYILEGPVRFGLAMVGAEMAIYARDGVMLGIIALSLLPVAGYRAGWPAPLLCVAVVLFCHAAIAFISLPSAAQAAMGSKVFMPLLFGVAIAPLLQRHEQAFHRFLITTFFVTALGVIGGLVLPYPWIGMSYDTAFGTLEVSRRWSYDGLARGPGFTRASYIAATVILFTLVPVWIQTRRPLARGALLAFATLAVLLTTTKAALTGLVCFLGLELLWWLGSARAWAVGMALLVLGCLLLPLLIVHIGPVGTDVPSWAVSFTMRIDDMWPRALALFDDPLQVLWGRGLGGVGVAQTYGEMARINSADNLMLYILVTFGVLGVIYVALFGLAVVRYVAAQPHAISSTLLRGWFGLWFSLGLTTNMIEDLGTEVVVGTMLGLALGAAKLSQAVSRSSSPPQAAVDPQAAATAERNPAAAAPAARLAASPLQVWNQSS